jgi:hypothetical protein
LALEPTAASFGSAALCLRFWRRLTAGVRLHCCKFAGFSLSLKLHLRESVEMPWPAFNEFGDLPVGVYRAMLAEVVAHFGHGTAQRIAITARLEHIYELARRTGFLQRFIIFGSYVTAVPNPRDVDIFLVMRGSFQPCDAHLKRSCSFDMTQRKASWVRASFGSMPRRGLRTRKI